MRPYLAIIKDSFREALASRVLWILLLLITVLLLALAPFTWSSTMASRLTAADLRHVHGLAMQLKDGGLPEANRLQAYLWKSLSSSTQRRINEIDDQPQREFRLQRGLVEDLNKLIEQPGFYQPDLWREVELSDRVQALIETAKPTSDETQQLNRLALEAAFPGQIRTCPEEAVVFRYLHWDIELLPTFSRDIAEDVLDEACLGFMSIFLGFFGVFAAILVTAPIIPNMLDTGSLSLLLSKPIARPLLFLAKFLGGCSFVLICAAYMIAGVWLVLGVRFGIWKPQLFWSIPVFLFSFAIFYSVSALSGLVWRSTVLAIVVTLLFWFTCFVVGTTKDTLDSLLIYPERITRILKAKDDIIVVRYSGQLAQWQSSERKWNEVFVAAERRSGSSNRGPLARLRRNLLVGPVYDETHDQLVALQPKWPRPRILVGTRAQGWAKTDIAAGPRNTRAIFPYEMDGSVMLVADGGIYVLANQRVPEKEGINLFGLKIPPPSSAAFHKISVGEDRDFRGNMLAAYDVRRNHVFLYRQKVLSRFAADESGQFRQSVRQTIEMDDVAGIAAGQGAVLLVDKKGHIEIVNGETLEHQVEFTPMRDTPPRQIVVSPSGNWFAVLFENDRLWLYDRQQQKEITRIPQQGSIAAVCLPDDEQMMLADTLDRVSTWSIPDLKLENRCDPRQSLMRRMYRYAVKPLHAVFPKPKDLQNTVRYIMTGKDTRTMEGPGMPFGGTTVKLDPWQPLSSNLVFMIVMLLFGCGYVYRQDF